LTISRILHDYCRVQTGTVNNDVSVMFCGGDENIQNIHKATAKNSNKNITKTL
jgi:hypothetical protein